MFYYYMLNVHKKEGATNGFRRALIIHKYDIKLSERERAEESNYAQIS